MLSILMKSRDSSLLRYERILNFAVFSGANGTFVELLSRQTYTVACPMNAQDGMGMATSMTVMFCVC